MGEIKWRRPHLRVAPPSEDMFQDDENEECGVYDAPRDLEDPVFDGLRNRSVRKVLVISYFSGHNFGDRLGVPILNSVLPSQALQSVLRRQHNRKDRDSFVPVFERWCSSVVLLIKIFSNS